MKKKRLRRSRLKRPRPRLLLRLSRPPFEPRNDVFSLFTPYLDDDRNDAWRSYLFLGRN